MKKLTPLQESGLRKIVEHLNESSYFGTSEVAKLSSMKQSIDGWMPILLKFKKQSAQDSDEVHKEISAVIKHLMTVTRNLQSLIEN